MYRPGACSAKPGQCIVLFTIKLSFIWKPFQWLLAVQRPLLPMQTVLLDKWMGQLVLTKDLNWKMNSVLSGMYCLGQVEKCPIWEALLLGSGKCVLYSAASGEGHLHPFSLLQEVEWLCLDIFFTAVVVRVWKQQCLHFTLQEGSWAALLALHVESLWWRAEAELWIVLCEWVL